jgi:hypothetical protein
VGNPDNNSRGKSTRCPHCQIVIFAEIATAILGEDVDGTWCVARAKCPNCQRFILELQRGRPAFNVRNEPDGLSAIAESWVIHPMAPDRPVADEVPATMREDFQEACRVLPASPKASAALSRRCLQNLLRTKAGVEPSDLSNEIQQVLDSGTLLGDLATTIDAIRNYGNFGAHPIRTADAGVIIDVERGEADWTLEILEDLFEFYYVRPVRQQARREALNKKLADGGKPPMKGT